MGVSNVIRLPRIRIYGAAASPSIQWELKDAAVFYLDRIAIPKKLKDITITIRELKDNWGDIVQLRGGCSYTIRIDNALRIDNMLRVLAHEMIHLKQFVYGELSFKSRYTYWRGKRLPNNISYEKSPWEREAAIGEWEWFRHYQDRNS
jgi:hypothetical protein